MKSARLQDQTRFQSIAEQWQAFTGKSEPRFREVWPREKPVSGLDILRSWKPENADRLETQWNLIEKMGVVPIVATVGLLNSGKSSLVTSFLSEGGASRVLKGIRSHEGSQRFTLWLPQSWREDSDFFQALEDFLSSVFGEVPESLSDLTEEAYEQQNQVRSIERPLMATDPGLDEHGIGILDCPDIQRQQNDDARHAELRLQLLTKAAEICAAVIIVSTRNQLEIRELEKIIACMPKAQRLLAVNLIREEAAHQILKESQAVLNLPSDSLVYGAYDFMVPGNDAFIPQWDPNRKRDFSEREKFGQPCFFELSDQETENATNKIGPERSLTKLAQRLSPESLQQSKLLALEESFTRALADETQGIRERLEEKNTEVRTAKERLLEECQHLLRDGNSGTKIKMSPAIVERLEESLTRTAPTHYRYLLMPSRKLYKTVSQWLRLAKEGLSGLADEKVQKAKEKIEKKLGDQGGSKPTLVGMSDLQRMLSLWSGAAGDYRAPEAWESESRTILERFRAEDQTNLTPEEWDEVTRPLWDQIPTTARLKIFSAAFLMLGGLLLTFVDGGISLVTISTLDLIGGVGLVAALGVSLEGIKSFQATLNEGLGRQQLANFHAIVCDVVGLPRGPVDDLPSPQVPENPLAESYGIADRTWQTIEVENEKSS